MPTSYTEGDLFAVPLDGGGYSIGLVARVDGEGAVFGYFFGSRFDELPMGEELGGLSPNDIALVRAFGDLGILRGDWPVIGQLPGWQREEWPSPVFGRRESLTGRLLRVEYADDKPSGRAREVEISEAELERLPEDGLAGFEFMQERLSRMLADSSRGSD